MDFDKNNISEYELLNKNIELVNVNFNLEKENEKLQERVKELMLLISLRGD